MTLRVRFHRFVVLSAVLVMVAMTGSASTARTYGVFNSSALNNVHSFAGATFTPLVAPVATVVMSDGRVRLSWPPVSLSSGAVVSYSVTRHAANGLTSPVCTGANMPISADGVVSCFDTTATAGETYFYTEQPLLLRSGLLTWTRPVSAHSNSLLVPRLSYAGAGPTESVNTNTSVNVIYPPGTQVNDLLLLISVSGRASAPLAPSGWTTAASVAATGSEATHLFVAWRLADAATGVSFTPTSAGVGASVRIVRYARTSGNAALPVQAHVAVATGSPAASTDVTPFPDIVTNGSVSTVISIVVSRSANSLSVASPQLFGTQYVSVNSPGSISTSLGLADRTVLAAGSVPSPTWRQSGTPGRWLFATVAFR